MKYCKNCGSGIKEGAKFCTSCGTPIKYKEAPLKKAKETFNEIKHKPKSASKKIKIIVALIAVVVLFFIGKALLSNINISRNSISVSKALTKIEGDWHDPSGALLGDAETIITFRKRGDVVIGEDQNKTLYIQLLAYGTNEYSGLVVLNGNDDNVIVNYYPDQNQLIFYSKLTEKTWYIKKIN